MLPLGGSSNVNSIFRAIAILYQSVPRVPLAEVSLRLECHFSKPLLCCCGYNHKRVGWSCAEDLCLLLHKMRASSCSALSCPVLAPHSLAGERGSPGVLCCCAVLHDRDHPHWKRGKDNGDSPHSLWTAGSHFPSSSGQREEFSLGVWEPVPRCAMQLWVQPPLGTELGEKRKESRLEKDRISSTL